MPDPNTTDPQPVPNAIPDLVEPGAVVTDPASIDAALKALAAQQASPAKIRWAGDEQSASEAAGPSVAASELKAPLEPQETKPPAKPVDFPAPSTEGPPAWAVVPTGLLFPQGRPAFFMRFDARLTYTPKQGLVAPDNGKLYRQCIFWPMSVGDKKIAAQRSMGDMIRFQDEMVKSCIRSIDGEVVTLANSKLDVWWDQVGEKVRTLLHRLYGKAHYLSPEETTDFLEHCVEARSAG